MPFKFCSNLIQEIILYYLGYTYVCACYDTIHPNIWPYDAKTVWIFITGKCCNPFSDPPALCTELTTDSSHGLRGVNKTILRSPRPLFVQNSVPCVFNYVTDKRTSVRNMPAVSKRYYHSTFKKKYFVTTIFTFYDKICQRIPWYYHDI